MRLSIYRALAAALLLAACTPAQRSMPDIEDQAELTAAVSSLSPWKDGSPDRSDDGRTPPEPGSERALFISWVLRYINHEQYRQHDRDYVPMVVPATIGEAVDEQRRYEEDARARQAQEDAEAERQRVAERAERDRLDREQQAAADEKARVETAQRDAENAARIEKQAEAAAATKRDFDCREQRQQALYTASLDRRDPQGAIAKVRSTMRCPRDQP